jgi:hypothetical protein
MFERFSASCEVEDRDPHDLAARVHETLDLGDGRDRVGRRGGRHRLHADRIVASDSDVPDHHDAGSSAPVRR